uniref:Conserved oligomeric Golgi complex subunit 6 n=1 Tax=Juniperus convallium var. microsperma TaxID=2773310 RepID=A0A3S6KJE0_9CONI|nr:putative COG7 [Juniperus microsperma]
MAVQLAPGLSRKLKKVLESRTDSPDLLASLNTLSTFYTNNTQQARRNLRSTIEKRALAINDEFLAASESAQKALDAVEQEIAGLAECCEKIGKALDTCSASTGDIITTTERLKQELESTMQRQEIVSYFLRDYQLSPEEVNALREEELNENFFKALARVQEIHNNCKMLLRTHHQRAGLELMDMMAVYQEGAYERLCRWVQTECRNLGDNDTPEVTDLLKTATRCLKERPVLFKYCAEEVANTRHNALFRRFISALTRGGPGGMPRPIEVHAHDPLRYVGDMLGWLHQALASERELILALFSPDATVNIGPTARRFSRDVDGIYVKPETDMSFILDRIFEGVCRPFKVRVEQVLQSQPSLLLAYKLSNILEFYTYTISDLLGEEAALSATLLHVKDAAQRTFFDILKSRGDKLLKYPSLVAVDLSPPPAVGEGVSLLLELIDTYHSMLVPASGKKLDFEPVISALLDPIIQMCEQAAEAYKSKGLTLSSRRNSSGFDSIHKLSHRPSSSMEAILSNTVSAPASLSVESLRKIFLVNCLSAIRQPLMGHEIAAKFVQGLGVAIEKHISILVDKEVVAILDSCGMTNKVSYIRDYLEKSSQSEIVSKEEDMSKPLAEIEEMSLTSISESLKSFFNFVAGSEGSLPEFEQLQVPQLRTEVGSRVARALAEAYELVHNAVLNPKNGYQEPKAMLRHSPDQIRTILGI